MKHHLITLTLVGAAAAFYIAGIALPATGLLIVGAIVESLFWLRLFRGPRHT